MISLVGAGPGDGRLISLLGLERIQRAEVILYDRLISRELLWEAPASCLKIDVGKIPGSHQVTQQKIQSLLLSYAKQYQYVVRLKGGDPFIFGRGSEEACFLAENQIPFEIVPGVSSLQGASAYSGIPLTHRGLSSGFHVYTGHGQKPLEYDFQTMAKLPGTILFFMAVKNMDSICSQLIAAGKDPDTPAAVIFQGTTSRQKVTVSTLGAIGRLRHKNPSLLVIGEVVKLQSQLKWFEQKPLVGKRVVITRPYDKSYGLRTKLMELGAEVVSFPCIQTTPLKDALLNHCLEKLRTYQWLFFTSSNAVQIFFQALNKKGLDTRALQGVKIFSAGPATKAALMQYGLIADFTLDYIAYHSVADFVSRHVIAGDKVLYPTSDLTDGTVGMVLEKKNACMDKIVLYKTEMAELSNEDEQYLQEEKNAFIVFGSPSQVRNYIGAFSTIHGVPVAYGQKTAAELYKFGYKNTVVSRRPEDEAVAECILNYSTKGELS